MSQNIPCFETIYDRKVAILGICALINQEQVDPEVASVIQQLFKMLIAIMSIKPQVKSEKTKSAELFQMLMEQKNGENQDEYLRMVLDAEDDKENHKPSHYIDRAEQLFSPLTHLDLYEHFRSIIGDIKEKSPNALKTLVNYLDPSEQQRLTVLLQTRHVGNEERRIVHPIRSGKNPANN